MKVTLESTDKIVTIRIDGVNVPARLWEGETERGIRCHAFITRIAVHKDSDTAQFERDLQEECRGVYDARIVL
mgnify:CR=1 FL=1